MKNIMLVSFCLFVLFACKEKKEEEKFLRDSSGIINNVSVIIDNDLWKSEVGDSIRFQLAAEVQGLPQSEPLFNLVQYPTNIFKGFMKNSRNIVIVSKGDKENFTIETDRFAKPQKVVFVSSKTNEGIIKAFGQHADEIIEAIKTNEIKERQRRIKKSLLSEIKLKEGFNLSLKVPSAYKYAMEGDKFFWIKKEIPSGQSSILVYEVPISQVEKDSSNIIGDIIKVRDSIGQKYIHGTLENTYMVTEAAYSPYFYEVEVNKKPCYLTKGTWDLKNDFMAGPFINYAIKDEKNNRFLVLEGFVYAPSKAKRDLVQELESIIVSAKIE